MNKAEAAREIDNTACCFSDKRFRDAMHMAADALRGPQPDPETGLVNCGCGEYPKRHTVSEWYAGRVRTYFIVSCPKGHVETERRLSKEEADKAWQTAMGYKEEE